MTPMWLVMAPVVNLRPGPSLMQLTRPEPTWRPGSESEASNGAASSSLATRFSSSPVLRTLGPGLGGSHSMSVSTERQSLAPPTATPTATPEPWSIATGGAPGHGIEGGPDGQHDEAEAGQKGEQARPSKTLGYPLVEDPVAAQVDE